MSEKVSITLFNPVQAHQSITQTWMDYIKPFLVAGHRLTLEVKKQTRTNEQNRRLWAMLNDVSRQVEWYGEKLTPDDWKTIFTAALRRERVVPGINGGFVVLGQSTSKMTKAEMCELQDLIEAFGAERSVCFNVEAV